MTVIDSRGQPRRTSGEIAGDAIHVYTVLKMGVLFWQGYKDAEARGATQEEALKAGVIQAAAWIGFFVWTLFMPLWIVAPFVKIADYYGGIYPGIEDGTPPWLLWSGVTVGVLAVIVQVACWLVLYSKLKDKLHTKTGRMYTWGFRIRRRFFLLTPWWGLWLISMLANLPMAIVLANMVP